MSQTQPTVARWSAGALTGDPVTAMQGFQDGIPVRSIATGRDILKMCGPDDELAAIIERNRADQFDYMPILDGGRITGLIELVPFMHGAPAHGVVRDYGIPLSENNLIGADASILAFVREADRHRCRLVVSGHTIWGMVCLSDLQRLPARAALFAMVTALEIVMAEAVRREFSGSDDWVARLSESRQRMVREEMDRARAEDAFVDALLFTQFIDKATIIRKSPRSAWSGTAFDSAMFRVQTLRNDLAHAKDYAVNRMLAANVCETVRKIDEWIAVLSAWPAEKIQSLGDGES
jgi:hypothetical protein